MVWTPPSRRRRPTARNGRISLDNPRPARSIIDRAGRLVLGLRTGGRTSSSFVSAISGRPGHAEPGVTCTGGIQAVFSKYVRRVKRSHHLTHTVDFNESLGSGASMAVDPLSPTTFRAAERPDPSRQMPCGLGLGRSKTVEWGRKKPPATPSTCRRGIPEPASLVRLGPGKSGIALPST